MIRSEIKDDYIESITRVVKYIDDNLDQELSVERLADVALFSKFHFHRIFKGAVGESLTAYVIRRRLERAIFLFKSRGDLTVTQVALEVGFNSPEHFSRSFKDKFGVTAQAYRNSDEKNPDSLKNSKMYQAVSENSFYHIYEQSRDMKPEEFSVAVREQPEYEIAFISDVFGIDGTNLVNAYLQLMEWANENDLNGNGAVQFAISRDDIEITPAEQYRMEFCISVPRGTPVGGRIGIQTLKGGTYALIPVQGDIHRVAQAWDHLYKFWLPQSNFRPIDEPAIEVFHKGPDEIGWENFDLEIGIPVEAL